MCSANQVWECGFNIRLYSLTMTCSVSHFLLLQDSAKAYSVLMSYLNLILGLFDQGDHSNQATRGHVTSTSTSEVSRQLLSPLLADSLVEIYAEHRPEQLTNFLLHSWVKNYSPGTHIDLRLRLTISYGCSIVLPKYAFDFRKIATRMLCIFSFFFLQKRHWDC